jgi:phosphopantetheinyl transferase
VKNRADYRCSVSHDDRFAVAVAGSGPIGVDVEKITPRALKTRHLFMQASEIELIGKAPVDEIEAALRIWSVKETVAKALDLPLADAWHQTRIIALEPDTSHLIMEDGRTTHAVHYRVDHHLFTLTSTSE